MSIFILGANENTLQTLITNNIRKSSGAEFTEVASQSELDSININRLAPLAKVTKAFGSYKVGVLLIYDHAALAWEEIQRPPRFGATLPDKLNTVTETLTVTGASGGTNGIIKYSNSLVFNASATEAAHFTALESGDEIRLTPAGGTEVTLTLLASPQYTSNSQLVSILDTEYSGTPGIVAGTVYTVKAVDIGGTLDHVVNDLFFLTTNATLETYTKKLDRTGETSTTVSDFGDDEVGIYSSEFIMAATSTEAAFFTALGSGDKVVLVPATGSHVVLTLSGTPATSTRNSHATVNIASTDYTLTGTIADGTDYTVYAIRSRAEFACSAFESDGTFWRVVMESGTPGGGGNFKLSAISDVLTTLASGDHFAVSDESATDDPNKKITYANLLSTLVTSMDALTGNARRDYNSLKNVSVDTDQIVDDAVTLAKLGADVSTEYANKDFARAQASIFVHWDGSVNPTGGVASVTVGAGGSGYTDGTAVSITGGGGSGATGTINVTSGAITSVTITSQGIGYTSVPTVSATGGTGATLTAVIEKPNDVETADTFGTGFTDAWDPTNKRWKIMDQSSSPNVSNIKFANSNIDWSHFSCHIDAQNNAVANGNSNGAFSFRFGDDASAGVGWAGSGSNGAGFWYTRYHGGTDDQKLMMLMVINDSDYRSALGSQLQGSLIKSSGTDSPMTFHNGAKTTTHSLAGNNNVGFIIPATNLRNKIRLVAAGNKFLIYVDGTLYVEIKLAASIPSNWGDTYSFTGDSYQHSGKLAYIYELIVGSPDPADLMEGYQRELPKVSTTDGDYVIRRGSDATIEWTDLPETDIHEFTTATPATTDFLPFSDESETGDPNRKATISDILALATAFKVSAITDTLTTPAGADNFVISDESETDDPNKKITFTNLVASVVSAIEALTGDDRLDGATLRNLTSSFLVSAITNTLTTPADDDHFVLSDESATGDPNKKITFANLKTAIGSTGFKVSAISDALTSLAGADHFVISDESATGDPNKKITFTNLVAAVVGAIEALTGDDRLNASTLRNLTAAFLVSGVTDTLTTLADDDNLVVSDESATGDPNKKITFSNFKTALAIPAAFKVSALTDTLTTPAATDNFVLSDESATGDPNKKITFANMVSSIVTALEALTGTNQLDAEKLKNRGLPVVGSTAPSTPRIGQLFTLSAKSSAIHQKVLGMNRTYENTATDFASGSSMFHVTSSGELRFHVSSTESTFLATMLKNNDKLVITTQDGTLVETFTLSADMSAGNINTDGYMFLTSSQYSTSESATFTDGTSYAFHWIGYRQEYKDTTFRWTGNYWDRLKDGSPDPESVPFGKNWEELWSDSDGENSENTNFDLDTGKSFLDYTYLMFSAERNISQHKRQYSTCIRSDFVAHGISIQNDAANINLSYVDSNTFRIGDIYSTMRLYTIKGR